MFKKIILYYYLLIFDISYHELIILQILKTNYHLCLRLIQNDELIIRIKLQIIVRNFVRLCITGFS